MIRRSILEDGTATRVADCSLSSPRHCMSALCCVSSTVMSHDQCDYDIAGVYPLMVADSEALKVLTEILDTLPGQSLTPAVVSLAWHVKWADQLFFPSCAHLALLSPHSCDACLCAPLFA